MTWRRNFAIPAALAALFVTYRVITGILTGDVLLGMLLFLIIAAGVAVLQTRLAQRHHEQR
jgi:hypothetical protein